MLSYRRSLVWPPGYIFQASLVVISYPPFLSSFFFFCRNDPCCAICNCYMYIWICEYRLALHRTHWARTSYTHFLMPKLFLCFVLIDI